MSPPRAAARIDLLIEWPHGLAGRPAVVVVEAKLGATVAAAQLLPYGREAAIRWFALMRRWEGALAAAGDGDPVFAAIRAHIWRFLLDGRGYL